MLSQLASSSEAPRSWRDRSDEALADADLAAGEFERAGDRYEALLERTLNEDVARTLEVKLESARSGGLAHVDPDARATLAALLVGTPGRPVDPWLGAEMLGQWVDRSKRPLASYLVGKNLVQRGWYAAGATALDDALEASTGDRGDPRRAAPERDLSPRVAREALRQRAIASCALGDRVGVDRIRSLATASTGPFQGHAGRMDWMLRLLDRCSTH
jgi:hypothetical protein